MITKSTRRARKPPAKRHPLNMRTTKEVREMLEHAAAETGRSLVQEVETRIEESVHADLKLAGPLTRALVTMIAAVVENIQQRHGKNWLDDDRTCSATLTAIYGVLGRLGADRQQVRESLTRHRRIHGIDAAKACLEYAGFSEDTINAAFKELK
jgi:hypothetical protein